MTDIVTPPTISSLPAAPQPTDTPAAFNTKSFALLGALDPMVAQINAVADATEQNAVAANERAVSANSAKGAAESAASAANADALRLASLDALWLGAAASDPTTGRGGAPLVAGNAYVNSGTGLLRTYNGTAWVNALNVNAGVDSLNGSSGALTIKTVNGQSLMGAGDIPISTWTTGDVLTTASTLAAPDWLEAGNVYLQSSYAALYAKLGLVSNGFSATSGTLPSTGQWTGVAYGNGVFVAVKWGVTGAFATSPDGVTWTARNAPSDQSWTGVAYGAGLFVAISGGSAASTVFATSPDGITWTQRTVPSSTHGAICFGAGRFVVVPQSGAGTVALTSTDGISWTTTAVPSAAAGREAVTFGNGRFVLVGGNGSSQVCATSPDGVTWTARSLPSNGTWKSVSYGAGLFVAVAQGSANFATSPDGEVWTLRLAPGSFNWQAVVFGVGGFLVCPNTSDGYAYSADGLTWGLTPVTGGGSELAHANGVYVSVLSSSTTARRLLPYTYDTSTQFYVPPANGVGAPYRQYVKA